VRWGNDYRDFPRARCARCSGGAGSSCTNSAPPISRRRHRASAEARVASVGNCNPIGELRFRRCGRVTSAGLHCPGSVPGKRFEKRAVVILLRVRQF
jgi:hypothetical protein